MSSKVIIAAFLFIFFGLGFAKSVQADPVTLTLTNPLQSGTPGTLLVFNATYTNLGTQSFMITGDIFNTSLDSVGLLQGLRPLGLIIPPGATVTTPLFSVLIAASAAPGPYTFTVFSEGFNPGGSLERSNTVSFTITVLTPTAVPEPTTLFLLGTGLMGILGARGRRHKVRARQQPEIKDTSTPSQFLPC